MIAYWSPVSIGSGLLIGLLLLLKPTTMSHWWNTWEKLSVADQGLLVGAILLIMTLLAFILEMLAEPIRGHNIFSYTFSR